jgi:hypothetical protein
MLFAVFVWRIASSISQNVHEENMCRILGPKNLNLPNTNVDFLYTEHKHFETLYWLYHILCHETFKFMHISLTLRTNRNSWIIIVTNLNVGWHYPYFEDFWIKDFLYELKVPSSLNTMTSLSQYLLKHTI